MSEREEGEREKGGGMEGGKWLYRTSNSVLVYSISCPPSPRLLVLKNRRSAMGVYSVYTQTHSVFRLMEGPPYEDKEATLLNFTWFLLLSTERLAME